MDPVTAPTVTLGKHTETLVEPSPLLCDSLGRTGEDLAAMPQGELLAMFAVALHGAWPADKTWPARPRPAPWKPTDRIEVTGQAIYDGLRRAKISASQIRAAGSAAYNFAIDLSNTTEQEVQALGDFSEAPAEGA